MDDKFKQNFIQQTVLSGVFYDAVINRPAGQTKKEATQLAALEFEPYAEKDFKTLFGDKYEAASWLAKNKSNLTSEHIYDRLKHYKPINDTNIVGLWDNLYYHITLQLPSHFQSTITNLLMIQHILINRKTVAKSDYMRLANATVIIPEKIFTEDHRSHQ